VSKKEIFNKIHSYYWNVLYVKTRCIIKKFNKDLHGDRVKMTFSSF